jgi:hypothetical protein
MSLQKSIQIIKEAESNQKNRAENLKITQDNKFSLEKIKAYCDQESKN